MANIVYIDYRFIVKAKDIAEASEKVYKFLPEATDEINYTPSHSSIMLTTPFNTVPTEELIRKQDNKKAREK